MTSSTKENLAALMQDKLTTLALSELAMERKIPTQLHEGILSVLALAKHGEKGVRNRYSHSIWKDVRISDHNPITLEQKLDRAELDAGIRLSRHAWLESLRQETEAAERLSPAQVLEATIARVGELSALDERDLELEQATVEMGFMFAHRSDYDGNPFTFIPVKATEGFVSKGQGAKQTPLEEVKDLTLRGTYGRWHLGGSIKLGEQHSNRWFISSWENDGAYLVPFDAITHIGTPLPGDGVEYNPLNLSNTQ
jgi:hypothetical protein